MVTSQRLSVVGVAMRMGGDGLHLVYTGFVERSGTVYLPGLRGELF